MSTVINGFCVCDLLARGVEQRGILGHEQAPVLSRWGMNFCLHLVLQLFRLLLQAKAQRMSSQSQFLLFPGTASPLPEPQGTVGMCPAP